MEKELPTGRLKLNITKNKSRMDISDICSIASRQNPKRGFLIVSKLIGRHIPTKPKIMRTVMHDLAKQIRPDLPGPVLFIGMAETAVGLGQGVHAAWGNITGRSDSYFIQTTRQTHEDMQVWFTVEEGHSHASTHLVHVPSDLEIIINAKSLVIVDDECSTGTTFQKVAEEVKKKIPHIEEILEVAVTDWAPGKENRVSLVEGSLEWTSYEYSEQVPGESANNHGKTETERSYARLGYKNYPRLKISDVPWNVEGKKVTVVADGEASYNALLVAEYLEKMGADTVVQSITRSPAHVCDVLETRAVLSDSYESGATCYSYNLMAHKPDYIVIVTEQQKNQKSEIAMQTGMEENQIYFAETSL
jgi:hypothetical protein